MLRTLLLLVTAYFCGSHCFAQTVEIDLAAYYKTDYTGPLPIENKITAIVLTNAFPNRIYSISVKKEYKIEPALGVGAAGAGTSACTTLQGSYDDANDYIVNEDKSRTEPELKAKLDDLLKQQNTSGCADGVLNTNISTLKANTVRMIRLSSPIVLESNADYTITVITEGKKWTYKMEGSTGGRSLLSYGFLFSPRGLESQEFYTKQLGADSFRISKKRGLSGSDLRFIPMVFFSYFFDKNLHRSWNNSFSCGLGFDTGSPVVSIGYNGMFKQVFGFSLGAVFYQQNRLDGKYNDGDIVKENLEEAQLYDKTFFRPNLFFAINFRLGQNPFEKSEDKKKE